MGTAITDILIVKELKLEYLKDKVLAVDAFNILYQFISTIRQSDGTPLMDSKGNVTSHLIGLFSRFTKLMLEDMKFVFVFDGKVPDMKQKERERRKGLKIEAMKQYEEAKKQEDVAGMKKFASRTSRLTAEMVEEAKKLITILGMPVVQAPSEGEAQASYMVAKGDCFAVVSQDADSLLFGANMVIKNLAISGRKKVANKLAYSSVNPEIISLSDNLNQLGIDLDQLIVLSILVGTDYNVGGVKGIGPKKALALVKEFGKDFEKVFEEAKWKEYFDFDWRKVFNLIKNIPVSDDYKLEWNEVDEEGLIKLLVEEHDFSRERVEKTIEKLMKGKPDKQQKSIFDF